MSFEEWNRESCRNFFIYEINICERYELTNKLDDAKLNYFTRLNKIDFFGSSSKSRSGADMPASAFETMLKKKSKFIPEVKFTYWEINAVKIKKLSYLQNR